jgi:hypothetical protein
MLLALVVALGVNYILCQVIGILRRWSALEKALRMRGSAAVDVDKGSNSPTTGSPLDAPAVVSGFESSGPTIPFEVDILTAPASIKSIHPGTGSHSGAATPGAIGDEVSSWSIDQAALVDEPGLPDAPMAYDPRRVDTPLESREYPVLELPLPMQMVKGTRKGRIGPRGVSESAFHERLASVFVNRILCDHRVSLPGANHDYEPDIILHFREVALRIDIEIDEPYSGISRTPMHWVGSYDDDRDLFFNNQGWIVVRFAERQVVSQPEACIGYLLRLVERLLGYPLEGSFEVGEDLIPVQRWTREQAIAMAVANERESYLNITFAHGAEPDGVELEAEVGLEREAQDLGSTPVSIVHRNTGLTDLPEACKEVYLSLQKAIEQDHTAFVKIGRSHYFLHGMRLTMRRARHFVSGFDLLTQNDVSVEIRRITYTEVIADLVLRAGVDSNSNQMQVDLEFAISEQLCVCIDYTSGGGGRMKRTISGIQPVFSVIYFNAWCHVREEGRQFRSDRIHRYQVFNLRRPWKVEEDANGNRVADWTLW